MLGLIFPVGVQNCQDHRSALAEQVHELKQEIRHPPHNDLAVFRRNLKSARIDRVVWLSTKRETLTREERTERGVSSVGVRDVANPMHRKVVLRSSVVPDDGLQAQAHGVADSVAA